MDRLPSFGYLVKDVGRLYSKYFEQCAKGMDLTMAQCKVLGYLARNEGITQIRLAELAETDPMSVVRIVDRMERDGLIERRPDPKDRRVKRLFLKARATPLLKRIWRLADQARAQALAGLSSAEHEQLLGSLMRVHANLTALEAGAAEPPARPAAADLRRRRTAAPAAGGRRRAAAP